MAATSEILFHCQFSEERKEDYKVVKFILKPSYWPEYLEKQRNRPSVKNTLRCTALSSIIFPAKLYFQFEFVGCPKQ